MIAHLQRERGPPIRPANAGRAGLGKMVKVVLKWRRALDPNFDARDGCDMESEMD